MGRVIQIVGTGLNAGLLPDTPGAERWGSNNPRVYKIRCPQMRGTYSRWFNVHSYEHIKAKYLSGYIWYQKQDGTRPLYFRDGPDPTIPGSLEFPGPMLMQYFGITPDELELFFTFSCAWLLAFAIWEHLEVAPIERIEFWGIVMRRGSSYDFERPGMHYWIGRARQAGIQISIPDGVDICRAEKIYGYQTTAPYRDVVQEITGRPYQPAPVLYVTPD